MKKKYKIDCEAIADLILEIPKFCILCLISLIIYLGYNLHSKLIDATSFQAWTFLGIEVVCICLIVLALFNLKFHTSFWIPILLFVVGAFSNLPSLFQVSFLLFAFLYAYELLKIFGLEVKLKLYWRGKKCKK